MGRGKREIKRIENQTNRQVTFSKRQAGVLKKTHELSVLCDAQIGLIIFSSTGKMSEYCSEPLSMDQIIEKYKNAKGDGDDHLQQMYRELTRMKRETHQLELSLNLYSGDDLSSIGYEDLDKLEHQLECSINKVRARKDQFLEQQLNDLQRKVGMLGEENDQLRGWTEEQKVALAHQQAITRTMEQQQVLNQFPFFGEAQPSTSSVLQLATLPHYHPYLLQPMQPNLQESSFQPNNIND